MYERLVKVFKELRVRYEIIFVNNNSPDNTEEVLSAICEKDINVIAIMHSRSFQSQSSFLSGMQISTGDAVVLLDGDLQDPPELIPQFFAKWRSGFDVVYGSRIKRDTSFVLNFFYKLFYRIFREVSYIPMPVNAGDFSLMDRRVVNEIIALPETDQFMRGLRAWVGFKQTGVDYVRPKRMFGESTNNWHRNFWWAKKAIFSFSFIPLELLTYGGVFLTFISFVAVLFQVVYRILHPELPHGVSLIIVLILFFGGIQLLAISIIGEYMAKVLEETKRRPKFIRKSILYKGKNIDKAGEIENIMDEIRSKTKS
jgi:glycosyltransferase involved in cell wall biosynthesis